MSRITTLEHWIVFSWTKVSRRHHLSPSELTSLQVNEFFILRLGRVSVVSVLSYSNREGRLLLKSADSLTVNHRTARCQSDVVLSAAAGSPFLLRHSEARSCLSSESRAHLYNCARDFCRCFMYTQKLKTPCSQNKTWFRRDSSFSL